MAVTEEMISVTLATEIGRRDGTWGKTPGKVGHAQAAATSSIYGNSHEAFYNELE